METPITTPTKFDQLRLEMFKTLLGDFIDDKFTACQSFHNELKSCKSDDDIRRLFFKYNDDVYEELGGDPELEHHVEDLKSQVRNLQIEVSELEDRVFEYENPYSGTLDDVFKFKFINENHGRYTAWELEELLLNGKELLKK